MQKLVLLVFAASISTMIEGQNTFPSNGNVGIGTTSPAFRLHVASSTGSPGDFIGYPGSSIGNVWPNGIQPEAIFEHPFTTTSTGGQYTYRGGIGLGHGVGIYSVNPNPAGSPYYGDIRFHTSYWNGSSYVNADRMVIDIAGNVGIGTSNPDAKLTVLGNISIGPRGADGGTTSYIGHTATSTFGGNSGWIQFGTSSNDEFLAFGTLKSGIGGGERMRIDPIGNVGIGKANPDTKLHVTSATTNPGDFINYPGKSVGNIWPNGQLPEAIFEHPYNTTNSGGQVTYRGGIGLGYGVGIYSLNPNPAGSGFYGDLRFHTTSWNGSSYQNEDRMVISYTGNVGIGTSSPGEKLSVNGNIAAKKLVITQTGWSDYVFDSSYILRPLSEVADFIKINKRLPDLPSAKEVNEKGINVGDNQALLLKKIEELTLYLIDLKEENRQQGLKITKLENQIKRK